MDWTVESYDDESVITLDDGYHVGTIWKMDVSSYTENICELNSFLKEKNMPFLYAALPGKISKADEEVSGVIDFSNQNYDAILQGIQDDGVEVLDFRENMSETFDDHHAQFFVTDHHWKPETGLWAAGELAKYLNENYGYEFDLQKFDSENFRKETYEDIFLGSSGRELTLSVAEPEDINLLYPNYDVNLTIEIPVLNLHKTGDFSVVYSYEWLERGDYYRTSPYAAYLHGGDISVIKLTNNDCDNDRSLLVVGDSMDNSMLPFLALGVKHITAIDLRAFTGSLRGYVEQLGQQYDMVIVTNSVISMIDPELFNFS